MKCVIPLFSIKNIVYTLPGTQYYMKYCTVFLADPIAERTYFLGVEKN